MEAKKTTRKILMLPWLAFGHISPYLELAKKLSQTNQNFQIYLCSSPINLQSIHTKLPQNSSNPIQLVHLNLPSLPELPPHLHSTNGLPLHLIPTLINAFQMASPEFSSVLQKLNPDLLITDTFQPWAIQSANSFNIPVVSFLVVGAAVLAHTIHYVLNGNTCRFPFPDMDLMDHWISKTNPNVLEAPDVATNLFLQWLQEMQLCSSGVFLVNSFTEIEGKYLDYLSALLKKKVLPVGPLVPEDLISTVDEKSDVVLEWLDKKQPKSTVYVSFGSEYYLCKEDREELAHGLELSGANFIWVLRFPKGEEIGNIEETLPNGFIERVGERGFVVDGWAPQLKILKHSSIGGFVCHCGWNSVVEAVVHGVPIIALPMQLDQPYHARVAVAAGVGVEAARSVDGAVEREGVAKAIKDVLFEKTGEDLNRKAKEICEILEVKEGQNIQECVAELNRLCELRQVCLKGNE